MKKIALPLSVLLISACTVGPDYVKPPVDAPPAYKETGVWKESTPMDSIDRGAWWTVYHDPILNALEQQIDISNQNLKEAEAAYRAAVAIADQTRSTLFPTVSLNPGASKQGTGPHMVVNSYDLTAGASWTLDIWGRIRRQLESNEATAQADAAEIASARLSAQGELATDYFNLRIQDELERLLDRTVEDDKKIVSIIQNQYKVGVAAQSDVLLAQTTFESANAQAVGTGITRAQLEHAIAVLVGRAPADFTLAISSEIGRIPLIPPEIPSEILQRRPDVAASERQMAAANAQIGVAIAAYYPTISLTASGGFVSSALSSLFSSGATYWSFGANAAETLIDFGYRDAATAQARATFDQSVATYRQTVLTAFQNVEDNLAAQRILIDQEAAQNLATEDAKKSEQIALNQYKEGIIPYNNVLTTQVTRLANEESSLTIRSSRLSASVSLIEALGGGWDTTQLPPP